MIPGGSDLYVTLHTEWNGAGAPFGFGLDRFSGSELMGVDACLLAVHRGIGVLLCTARRRRFHAQLDQLGPVM